MSKKRLLIFLSIILCLFLLVSCAAQEDEVAPSTDESNTESSEAPESGVQVEWTFDSDCSACHKNEGESYENQNCLASQHASLDCVSCHSDESSLATAHEDITATSEMPKRLKKTTVEEEYCISCHGSYEDLASKTADSTILTDANGTTVNPHAIPQVADHENITCNSCHAMHAVDQTASEDAEKACLSCHHENVYECGTCHA